MTVLLAATALTATPVWAVDFIVSTNADSGAGSLRQAIADLNASGGASNNIIINSGVGTITLASGDLQTVARNATIVGNNNTLSGGGNFRGLFIGAFSGTTQTAVTVSVADLTITNTRASGGSATDGGAGGAGLGGALFVASQASVTVSNVTLDTNNATGGSAGANTFRNGGGGGMGGNGGAGANAGPGNGSGGGGGLGSGADGGSGVGGQAGSVGIATGGASGGTGAGNPPLPVGGVSGGGGGAGNAGGSAGGGGGVGGANAPSGAIGGAGGFGGGGGAGVSTPGGAGGFGGGGGAAFSAGTTGGAGGFGGGGGNGSSVAGAGGFGGGNGGGGPSLSGGGGAGMGGAAFVQEGGNLTLAGPLTINGNTVTGGTGANNGSAFGAGLFLQGNGTVTFAPGSSQSQAVGDVIADQTGSGGSGVTAGSYSLVKQGAGTTTLSAANTYSGGTSVTGGTLAVSSDNNLGAASGGVTLGGGTLMFVGGVTTARAITLNASGGTVDTNHNTVTLSGGIGGVGGLTVAGTSTLLLSATNTYGGATTIGANSTLSLSNAGSIAASSGVTLTGALATFDISLGAGNKTIQDLTGVAGSSVLLGNNTLTVGTANSTTFAGVIDASGGTGGIVKAGTGTLTLSGTNTYTGGTTINAGTLSIAADSNLGDAAGALALNGGTLQITGANVNSVRTVTLGAGGGTFDISQNANLLGNIGGTGGLTKSGAGTLALGGTSTYGGATTINAGLLELLPGASIGTGALALNGGSFNNGGNAVTVSGLSGSGGLVINGGSLAVNTVANNSFAGAITGTGALVKQGTGTLTLTGNNLYSGGTTVSGGILAGTTASLQGNILNNAIVSFNQAGNGTYAGAMSGSGGVSIAGGGVLSITGNNTYTGPTTVTGGGLVVNGSLASTVTLDATSAIGGNGTIGGLVSNGAMIAPGNSIGTLNVNGNFSQTGGTYVVEANAQGQSDRVNVTGTATISGASVQLVAASGSYGTRTTYTILNAAGGVSGTYTGVTSNFAFLTPSLSYDANNVFLTLALQGNAFSGFGGNTRNQRAVGYALDQSYASATGDFATVIGALAGLSTTQGPLALTAISGEPYADFGTTNVANASLFMNTLGQQMANARSGSAVGARVALAQACDVEACDDTLRLSAWFSGLGGLGSVQGNGNSSTLTYNVGGAAAGVDYRVTPNVLLGLGVGYTHGTQWVNSFMGQGWTDSVSLAAYGSFTQAGFYADGLAGYAYLGNQMQRQILIPGLQQRTASGSTGSNQFLAQLETGYKLGLWDALTVTLFGRFQTSITTQNAFTESGANALNLTVAQQTTNSVRTVLGAELGSTIPLGAERAVGLNVRLGWQHEYASTERPITAAFGGAPTASFTVYGATPTRDAAIVGFSATTSVAAATQVYLRYDGELGSGTDNHALTAGLRMSW